MRWSRALAGVPCPRFSSAKPMLVVSTICQCLTARARSTPLLSRNPGSTQSYEFQPIAEAAPPPRTCKEDPGHRYSPATAAGAQAPVFQVQRVYLKDASLEMPNAPTSFWKTKHPRSMFNLKCRTRRRHRSAARSCRPCDGDRQGEGQGSVPGRRQAGRNLRVTQHSCRAASSSASSALASSTPTCARTSPI